MKTSNTLLVTLAVFLFPSLLAVTCPGAVFDQEIPARNTAGFQQAIFRLWLPDTPGPVQGMIVQSGDAQDKLLDAPEWQEFARKHQMAMLNHNIIGQKGAQGPVCEPVFDHALQLLGTTSKHSEITTVPLLMFGRSHATAAGFFPWRKTTSPRMGQRVLAFAATSWDQLLPAMGKETISQSLREIPGLLLHNPQEPVGDTATAKDIFLNNRRRGAPWCLAVSTAKTPPNAMLIRAFFEGVIAQRMPPAGKGSSSMIQLKPIDERNGWLGNPQTKEIAPSISYIGKAAEAVWLPDEASAKKWQEYLAAK